MAEERTAVVDDGPSDPVANVGGVGFMDIEDSNIVEAVPDVEEGSIVAALDTKKGVKEHAECVDVQLEFKVVVRRGAWAAVGQL